MSDPQKLTAEELLSVTQLREQIVGVISTVGQLKLTHDLISDDLQATTDKLAQQSSVYKELLNTEKQLMNSLLEKYGIGSLDIDTGIFTPEK
jgi:DNA anti-recombination protein RmuC